MRPARLASPSPRSLTLILRAFVPACQVMFLFGGKPIDFDAHGFQLHTGHLFVQVLGHRVDALFEAGMILDHVFGG